MNKFTNSWYSDLNKHKYTVEEVIPNFILDKRMDIGILLYYIDSKIKNYDRKKSIYLYKKRIEIVTKGSFSEIGNEKKNTFKSYLDVFDSLISDFQNNNFVTTKSLIPIDRENFLLDGSHRVACSIYFNRPIQIAKFNEVSTGVKIDKFWLNINFGSLESNFIFLFIQKYSKNIRAFIFWPKSKSSLRYNELINELKNNPKYIYNIHIDYNENIYYNLIFNLYYHNQINMDKYFLDCLKKKNEILNKNFGIDIYFYNSIDDVEITHIKKFYRNLIGFNYSSVHSTDNYNDTLLLCDILMKPNSLIDLNRINLFNSFQVIKKLSKFNKLINNCKFETENFVIDGSVVLDLFNIRKANDIDFLTTYDNNVLVKLNSIMNFSNHYEFRSLLKSFDLNNEVFNPLSYFTFIGLKISRLENVLEYKQLLFTKKHINDVKLIKLFLLNSKFNLYVRLSNTISLFFLRLKKIKFSLSYYIYSKILNK